MQLIPLSIYVHLPWCVQKCPYCDFNSHAIRSNSFVEETYVNALLDDIRMQAEWTSRRTIHSIFFGGGTPSLFQPKSIARIVEEIARYFTLPNAMEITLEANPGASDQSRFLGYRSLGVNRLSIGVQSFQEPHLQRLGRIHDTHAARLAIQMAHNAGFERVNIDLMFGLPEQTIEEALADLNMACDFSPAHVSWYQLTIEPNTLFFKHPPTLPKDEHIDAMQTAGVALLAEHGFKGYEISAYSRANAFCRHNVNYWQFGDYLGIGAGAHGKISAVDGHAVIRTVHVKQPKDYLIADKRRALKKTVVPPNDLPFEFMLNALRLVEGVPVRYWTERTGESLDRIQPIWEQAITRGLMVFHRDRFQATPLGLRFLNDVTAMFIKSK